MSVSVGFARISFIVIFAVLVDDQKLCWDNIGDCVDHVAVYKNSRLLLVVEDKPQHHRQKHFSKTSEEIKRRRHSKLLGRILVEDLNYLRDCESDGDADVTASDKSVYFGFGCNNTRSHLHLSGHIKD